MAEMPIAANCSHAARFAGDLPRVMAEQRSCAAELLHELRAGQPLTANGHGALLGLSDWVAEEVLMLGSGSV